MTNLLYIWISLKKRLSEAKLRVKNTNLYLYRLRNINEPVKNLCVGVKNSNALYVAKLRFALLASLCSAIFWIFEWTINWSVKT